MRINRIRDCVASWRAGGYGGISRISRELLDHWSGSTIGERRPFFCQLDAIEALIWLCEALPASLTKPAADGAGQQIAAQLAGVNEALNESISRLAVKMATGTGKTWVMAMIILWQALRKKSRTDILVLTPNLTVRDRLAELDPGRSDMKLYRDLLPPGAAMPQNLRVTVLNFQAFHRRTELAIDGMRDQPSGIVKKILNPRGEEPEGWTETDDKMLRRMLSAHRGAESIVVINDESHHCRRPVEHSSSSSSSDDANEEKEAAVWFGILRALKRQGRLGHVFDLSATPMYLQQPANLESEIFPWTVSDYSLIDAIEAGLTKIPTVPTSDNMQAAGGQTMPLYRNLYSYLPAQDRKIRHDAVPGPVRDLLGQMHANYNEVDAKYSEAGIVPVMIVVANNVRNANEFYRHIAGHVGAGPDGEAGMVWHPGQYPRFSNIKPDSSGPAEYPPTLLVHSRIDEASAMGEWNRIADLQKEFFSPDGEPTKKDRVEHIRKAFNTVGQRGKPGEHVRCIISVSMLSEGWDVRTVTHIFGFRPFNSQLLCEQVAGRALRRTSLHTGEDGLLGPEYARIFGVPFSFMRDGKDRPVRPTETWTVRTVAGRGRRRIRFPNVASYRIEPPSARCMLDPDKVCPYEITKAKEPTQTTVAGPAGAEWVLYARRGKNQIIYKVAESATQKFREVHGEDGGFDRRMILFASMVRAVKDWLSHPLIRCDDLSLLDKSPHSESVPDMIARSCVQSAAEPAIHPVFMDEHDPSQPHMLDTSDVEFETSLKHRYPKEGNTACSELNAAACHTQPEVVLAGVLDRHPKISAWARNFRLGWSIPYLDRRQGRWRRYEPDFVARIPRDARGPRHLVIEFKGIEDDDAVVKRTETEEMWIPAVSMSDDPACAGTWRYVVFDPSDDAKSMRSEITRLAGPARGGSACGGEPA